MNLLYIFLCLGLCYTSVQPFEDARDKETALASAEPIIEMEPMIGEDWVVEGDSPSFWCHIKQGEPIPTVTWTKKGDGSFGRTGEELPFLGVHQHDSGEYICEAANGVGSNKYGNFKLNVYPMKSLTGGLGRRTRIASRQKKPEVGSMTWYRRRVYPDDSPDTSHQVGQWLVPDGAPSTEKGYRMEVKTGDLIIEGANKAHEAEYTYMVTDIDGAMTRIPTYTRLQLINVSQLYTTCAHDPDPTKLPEKGTEKTIGCFVDVEGEPESSDYSWYKDDLILTDSGKYGGLGTRSLVVRTLEEKDDGRYSCKLKNDAGLGITSAIYLLEVLYSPEVLLTGPDTPVIVGNKVEMKCEVLRAKPKKIKTLQWKHEGLALGDPIQDPTEEDFVYKIDKVSASDKGRYTCEATNEVGMGTGTFNLKVYCEC